MPELHPMMARIVDAATAGDINLVNAIAAEASALSRDIINIVEWYIGQENMRDRQRAKDFELMTGTFDAVKGLADS